METKVKRKKLLTTKEELAEHLKCVGRAIVSDADQLALEPGGLCRIAINVEIAPDQQITVINYKLERIADARLPV